MSSADLIQGATCAALLLCVCVLQWCTDSLAGVLIDSSTAGLVIAALWVLMVV